MASRRAHSVKRKASEPSIDNDLLDMNTVSSLASDDEEETDPTARFGAMLATMMKSVSHLVTYGSK